MAEEDLDAFLAPDNETSSRKDVKQNDDIDLEDEFSKLLDSFVNQENKEPHQQEESPKTESLDDFGSTGTSVVENELSLDNFETKPQSNSSEKTGLDSFETENGSENFDTGVNLDSFATQTDLDGFIGNTDQQEDNGETLDSFTTSTNKEEQEEGYLKSEEKELARAVANFQDAVKVMANNKNLKLPKTDYVESMLSPNYKPSVGKKIAEYLLNCWDMIKKYDPENMKRLSPDAGDEEYLSFAESLNDTSMQLAIISYVEILINIEICEVSYEQKKDLAQKSKIKRELYEEYMELQERKKMFIQKLKEKKFPIDEDKLINNYFHIAQKDPDGAFEALTKNPAMFSPIQFEKMHSKFFGLIKVSPEDGIKANQKIGAFIKKLKV